jgi:hypothetical protein
MYPLGMTRSLAVAAGMVMLALPSAASAASLTVSPQKPCYGSGESVSLIGTGFSPTTDPNDVSDRVQITRGSTVVGRLRTDAFGAFNGVLGIAYDGRRQTRTYTATDLVDPSLTASAQITVSAVRVGLRPANGAPGRIMSVTARGFTTGPVLWAHVRHGGSTRSLKIGRLSGACHGLKTRRRLLPQNAALGVHTIQFDTFRRYRAKRQVKDSFTVSVTRG